MWNLLALSMLVIVAFICFSSSLFTIQTLRRKKNNPSPSDVELKWITYRDIAETTNGFSPDNLIGSGSSSSVYKGKLGLPEKSVAIKVFNNQHSRSLKCFYAECEALSKLRHRNLVKIFTSCSSLDPKGNDFKALVFEYMHNGSVEDWLHPRLGNPIGAQRLNLKQRISIVADVASALNYLHHEHGDSPVFHCDIKPSNVLLDISMTAHLSDFGLSRFLLESTSTSSLGELKGTIGYTPPDKLVHMVYPDRIAEMLDPALFPEEGDEPNTSSNIKFKDLCDSIMEKCIVPLVSIGLYCCRDSVGERMNVKDVPNEICAIMKVSLEI